MRATDGVLAVQQDGHDAVLATAPALRAIAAGSEGPLTLLCGPRGAEAGRALPGVDDVLVYASPWIDPAPAPVRPAAARLLVEAISCRRPREAVIFTASHQSPLPTALLLRLAGVPRVAAIATEFPGALLDVCPHVDDRLDEVDRALSLTAAAGYRLPAGDDGGVRLATGEREVTRPDRGFGRPVRPGSSVAA
jgi:hypothetical protein